MALTLTLSGDWQTVEGPRRKSRGTLAFDSSYPTGGESLTAADVGLRVIERVTVTPTNGYTFEYDHTNSLLKVFKAQSTGILNCVASRNQSTSAGIQDLATYSLPAGTLSVNNMGVRYRAWGWNTSASTANMVRSLFGSFIAGTFNLYPAAATSWNIETVVLRTGATSQTAITTFDSFSTLVQGTSRNVTITYPNMTLTAAQALTTGCSANAISAVVQEANIVELLTPTGTGTVGVEVESTADLSGLTGVRFEITGY